MRKFRNASRSPLLSKPLWLELTNVERLSPPRNSVSLSYCANYLLVRFRGDRERLTTGDVFPVIIQHFLALVMVRQYKRGRHIILTFRRHSALRTFTKGSELPLPAFQTYCNSHWPSQFRSPQANRFPTCRDIISLVSWMTIFIHLLPRLSIYRKTLTDTFQ